MAAEERDIQVFHPTRGVMIVFGVFTAGLACALLSALLDPDSGFLSAMFAVIFGTGFVILLVNLSRSLTLHGPHITIEYIGREKKVHAGEVKETYVEERLVRGIRTHYLHLKLKDGKDLMLNNYKEGFPALKEAVEKWFEKHKTAV
jgi:hypothetical protein